MKYSRLWLKEWIATRLSPLKLNQALTEAGFEVEAHDRNMLDIAIYPNRGDCLSMLGMAREIAAITQTSYRKPALSIVKPVIKDTVTVQADKQASPQYLCRVIRNVNPAAKTPAWMVERLAVSGIKSIYPVVDVMNYVMLELGQPMHAFDLRVLTSPLTVRFAKREESILLLDGSKHTLTPDTIVIADRNRILAMAGVMGGLDSAVTAETTDVLLESAYFPPACIAKTRQQYRLLSESATRFERGVDPLLQAVALERATKLILEIASGQPGPVVMKRSAPQLPKPKTIHLTQSELEKCTGISFKNNEIIKIFKALNFNCRQIKTGFQVTVPTYRFDLALPEDLIEEVIRLHGVNRIPATPCFGKLAYTPSSHADENALRTLLAHQGYHEVISYSFVDEAIQQTLNPNIPAKALANPMTDDMKVMRTSLWPGLIQALCYNHNRQQSRIALFEMGTIFLPESEPLILAGLLFGPAHEEQWGIKTRLADFYDMKGHLEAILAHYRLNTPCRFIPEKYEALHEGKSASIYYNNILIGKFGALHPTIVASLKLPSAPFVFELQLALLQKQPIALHPVSVFPAIRRDLAFLITETVSSELILNTIRKTSSSVLKDSFIFDVYQGKGIAAGCKSIALALILQHNDRTLVDQEVTMVVDAVVLALQQTFGATLRNG